MTHTLACLVHASVLRIGQIISTLVLCMTFIALTVLHWMLPGLLAVLTGSESASSGQGPRFLHWTIPAIMPMGMPLFLCKSSCKWFYQPVRAALSSVLSNSNLLWIQQVSGKAPVWSATKVNPGMIIVSTARNAPSHWLTSVLSFKMSRFTALIVPRSCKGWLQGCHLGPLLQSGFGTLPSDTMCYLAVDFAF